MAPAIFFDTSYAIALAINTDRHHSVALRLENWLEQNQRVLITTHPILLEIGNFFSHRNVRRVAVELLNNIENHPKAIILPLTDSLYQQGRHIFDNRPDKDWGMVDCVSFAVMMERNLTDALTADEHFEQAGFKALLLKPTPTP